MPDIFDAVAEGMQFRQPKQREMDIFDQVSGKPGFQQPKQQTSDTRQGPGQSFRESTAETIRERVKKTAEFAKRRAGGSIAKGLFEAPSIGVIAAGQAANVALDAAGDIAVRTLKAVTPEPIKEFATEVVSDVLQTPIGKAGLTAMQMGGKAKDIFKKHYPDLAITIESAMGATVAGIGKKGVKLTAKEISDIGTDISRIVGKGKTQNIENMINSVVKHGMVKAIKPKRVKGGFSMSQKSFADSSKAIQTIIDNKQSLSFVDDAGGVVKGIIPENLSQMAQAVEQVKRKVFSQYDEIAKSTNQLVPTDSVVKKLESFLKKKAKKIISSPGTESRINTLIKRFNNAGPLSAKDAQELVAEFNGRLAAFHANPSVRAKGVVDVDNEVVVELRKALNDTISNAKGPEFEQLRKRYGALTSLEDDVGKALHKDLTKANASFGDMVTNLGSGTQMAYAVATQNAALATAAIASKGIGKFHNFINNPNKIINTMFKNAEKLMVERAKRTGRFVPESTTGRTIERLRQ